MKHIAILLCLMSVAAPAAEAPLLPTAHTTRNIEGWTVRVDDRLLYGEGVAAGELALKLLTSRLVAITFVVPEKSLATLRSITIQLDLNHGDLRAMQYHPDAGWLKAHGYSEQLAKCVHIPEVQDFLSPEENLRMPWVVLHELAHAFHDQRIGFEEPRVAAAWKRFCDSGKYKSVLTTLGHMREHYGLTDPKEFFAEMTECYFGSNDFYPFVTGELKQAEPETFALLADIWGPLPGVAPAEPVAAKVGGTRAVAAAKPAAPAWPVCRDGQMQVVPAFDDPSTWVRELLWVETEFDSDGDGRPDRVFTDVTRPGQTETEGLKVPVIYESSPYFAGTAEDKGLFWDVQQEVGEVPPPRTNHTRVPYRPGRTNVSDGLIKEWVPRGFAVVHSDAPGTGLSDGCVTIGGPPEALAAKAVIDWLNGRARGFRTREGTEEVRATRWCTGKVGMIGTSYNGTIPVAAATTGVKGLEAIIPVAPNTSYYHYYRSHGLIRHPGGWMGEDIDTLYDSVRSGDPARAEWGDAHIRDGVFARGRDRQTGDYNAFWAERDLLKKVRGVRAAVLMAHAFNDWNVMPEHSVRIAIALKGRVPLRMYFHQGGHGGDPPMEMVNRWFTRYLYGIPNGVDKGSRAWIARETDPCSNPGKENRAPPLPTPYADYPNPEAAFVTLRPGAGGGASGRLGVRNHGRQGTETLVDNVEVAGAELAKAGASGHRLLYATAELLSPVHISGTPRITLRLASSKPAANLSVWLVVLPWADGPIGPSNIITRGWADPQNHKSLKRGGDYHSMKRGEPLVPGRFYRLTFELQPDDQVIPAGKRIGLMIFSSDRDFTLWPKSGTELTLDLDGTRLQLPVVGGRSWYEEAVGEGS